MSWQLFKQNILAVANRPEGIPDIDTIAKLYADEYDAAVKRGGDALHGIPINSGNKLAMEQFFKLALQKGLTATGPYDLVGEMGNGVKAYWAGARMKTTGTRPGQPLPIVPPVPKVTSIQLNVVLNNGIWIPPVPTVNASIADSTVIGAPPTPPSTTKPISELTEDEVDALEAEAHIEDEKRTKDIQDDFNSLFDSKEAAEAHNKPIPYTPDRQYTPVDEEEEDGEGFYLDGMDSINSSRRIAGTPYIESANGERWTNTMNEQKASGKGVGPKTKPKKSKSKSYQYLKDTYGDGEYPAVEVDGDPGRFVVITRQKGGRLWYKPNRSFAAKQYTSVTFPFGRGTTSFLVHKKIAARAQQAAKLMTERKLGKFVKNIGGSIAVRNTTTQPNNDRDLSRHAWGLAVDVNSEAYQYGTRFSCDFKQIRIQGKWRDVDADDIGFLKIAQCFIEAGFGWLGNCSQKDAMHFSVDEGGYTGAIPV
jgi:hypothetical protein